MFVRSEIQPVTTEEAKPTNPDEIEIDDDDEEEEDTNIEEKQVPRQVFGSLKKNETENEDN